ncbi:MAG: SusC/RagA family TonB-linked outer membrane protein [Gemmatimonadota bacterium]|nr:SusC/RagA family TonB-linked outer membrane protein [Gemmatimonadota bacterium]
MRTGSFTPTRAPSDRVARTRRDPEHGDPRQRTWLVSAISFVAMLLGLLLATPGFARAQEGVVAGTVLVEGSQRPLGGAQVSIAGQPGKGAFSDASGRFRITGVTGDQVTVSARLIGYGPRSQVARVGATNVRIELPVRALDLDRVVVTGTAGGEQRRAIGNSVATVNAADVLANTPVPSVQDLINGRAPGVVVMPGTGMVGSGSKIRIRGLSTFSLSGDPLIYVDGIRVDNETGTGLSVQAFGSGVVSRLNDFEPEQIENIEILKGSAAATLYGTEAARGVINIITKKGAAGGTKFDFTVRGGENWFMDAEHRIGSNYWLNPTTNKIEGVNVIATENARGTPVFRNGGIQSYAGNVSGGSGTIRYFASGELGRDQGAEPNNERRKTSARTNLSITPNEKFDLQASAGYLQSNTTLSCEAGCGGAMWGSLFSNPENLGSNCPPNPDFGCGFARGFNDWPPEVYRAMTDGQDVNRFTGSFTTTYKPLSWMTHRLAIGTDFTQEKNSEFLPYLTNDTAAFFWGNQSSGYKFQNRRDVVYNTYDYTGTGRVELNPAMSSATSFGVQYYTKAISSITGEGDFFPAPGLETIGSAATKLNLSDDFLKNNTLGFYLQELVGFHDRLFLTGAVRIDNNSAFGKDIHWVKYPKASLSWVLNEEPSFKTRLPTFVNSLKVRAAYGQSGQQPVTFSALRTLSPVAGPNGSGALTPLAAGNSQLKPERVGETEVGFETNLLDDRLSIDFTYYRSTTRDAILARGVAPSTGFPSSQFVNLGEIQNKGIEALFKTQLINEKSHGWEMSLNLATNSGKVLRLNGKDTTIDLGSVSHRVGYAPWSFFSYRVVSAQYDPVTKRAINAMCDDGKGGITACLDANGRVIAPKVFLGRSVPGLEGSWTSTIRFLDRFRLYGMVDFKSNYKRLDNNLRIRCQIFHTCLEWLEPDKTDPRRLAQMQTPGTLRDFVINDAKFAKLREISLVYDAPDRFARHVGARTLAVSIAARNLHTWTPYTGLDPESQFLSGSPIFVDQAELPQLASVVWTLRFGF